MTLLKHTTLFSTPGLGSEVTSWDLPGGAVDKSPPVNAGDTVLIPVPGGYHRAEQLYL